VGRGASVVAIVFVRACVAATLAYAFWPAPALVVVAALFDAAAGYVLATRSLRALVPLEVGGRLAILIALRAGWLGGHSHRLGDPSWLIGYLGSLVLWFSPIAVGRLAVVPILDAWRVAGLHADERARRCELAIGVTLILTAAGIARLVRAPVVTVAALVVAAVGGVALASAAVRTVRHRRFLARVRSGEVMTHRLEPVHEGPTGLPALDEDADAILVAAPEQTTFRSSPESVARVRATGPRVSIDVGRIVTFAVLSLAVTFGFDRACWHGSGWVVLRRKNGDDLLRPRYLRPWRVMEWRSDRPHYGTRYWEDDNERLEPHGAWFARVAGELDPETAAINVPEGTCARPYFERKRHPMPRNSARSIDERSRIVEPIKKDGRLIYTWREPDGRLVRADVALDGKSAVCTTDPPPVDDGDASSRLVGASLIVAGGSYTCAWVRDAIHCWGRVTGSAGPAQSIPEWVGRQGDGVVTGDGVVCTLDRSSCRHATSTEPVFQAHGAVNMSGSSQGYYGNNGLLLVQSPAASFASSGPPSIDSLTFARDRACFLRADRIECIGSSPPPLVGVAATQVAIGSSLACYRGGKGDVWCTTGSQPAHKVEGLPRASAIDVGEDHACALADDSTVWCWGRDDTKPVRVLGDAFAIATGARHSCAVGHDAKVRCWGANGDGQLGDGTFVDRATPVEVVR